MTPACETCGAARTAESSAGGLCAACLLAVALTDPSTSATPDDDAFGTLPAGTALGPFVIRSPLGRGGMGAVYEAQDTRLDRAVALKVLPAEFLHDKTFGRRFEAEARVIARLEHPNIVPIYASGIDSGVPWMSMRLLTGGSLSALLDGGPLAPRDAVRVLRDIAAALDYAHGLGVVHRDIKPANILFDRAGTASVADFGLAQLSGSTSALTQTGMITGTPHYMAPEQALGRAFDYRCDIYSLGIVAYEMLVGKTPFSGPSPVAVLLQHTNEPLPPPPGPPSSSVWMDAVRKAAAKDPADRWSSAGAFVDALAVKVDAGAGAAAATAASLQRQAPSSRMWWAAAGGAAIVVMAGVIWAVVHDPDTGPPAQLPTQATAPQSQAAPVPSNPAPPSNDPARPPKTDGTLSNRESRARTADRQPSRGSAVDPVPPKTSTAAPVEAPAGAPAAPVPAQVESPVIVEPLTSAPGLPVPSPHRAADVITEPQVIRQVKPVYPPVAIAADLQGTVILEGLIGIDGKVRDITVVRSVHPVLDTAARNALAQYQFEPGRRNGTPEPRRMRFEVPFTLKQFEP